MSACLSKNCEKIVPGLSLFFCSLLTKLTFSRITKFYTRGEKKRKFWNLYLQQVDINCSIQQHIQNSNQNHRMFAPLYIEEGTSHMAHRFYKISLPLFRMSSTSFREYRRFPCTQHCCPAMEKKIPPSNTIHSDFMINYRF